MSTVKLGKKSYVLRSPFDHKDYFKQRTSGGKVLGIYARHVYHWDCSLGDYNGRPPRYLTVGPNLGILALTKDGKANGTAARAMLKQIFAETGLGNVGDLLKALFKAYPLKRVEVPYAALLQGVDRSNAKYKIFAWVHHVDVMLVPGNSPQGLGVILSVPTTVDFQLIQFGQCKGHDPKDWVSRSIPVNAGYNSDVLELSLVGQPDTPDMSRMGPNFAEKSAIAQADKQRAKDFAKGLKELVTNPDGKADHK